MALAADPLGAAGPAKGLLLLPAALALVFTGLGYAWRRAGLLVWGGAALIALYLAWLVIAHRPVEWLSPLFAGLLFLALELGSRAVEGERRAPNPLLSVASLGELGAGVVLMTVGSLALLGLVLVPVPSGVALTATGAAAAVLTVWLVAAQLGRPSGLDG